MIVIDASVILAAFFPDENSLKARKLIADYVSGNVELYAPRLLLLELINSSLVAFRRGRIDEAVFDQLVSTISSLQINWIDIETHGKELASLAKECKITAYDAAYVYVAKLLQCKVVSGDLKLVMAVGDPVIRLDEY